MESSFVQTRDTAATYMIFLKLCFINLDALLKIYQVVSKLAESLESSFLIGVLLHI